MLGHSNLPLHQFIELLTYHQVTALIDVRLGPYCRQPQFCSGFLSRTLPDLYQRWPILACHRMIEQAAIVRALEQVLSRCARPCLLCSEADYRRCHRYRELAPLALTLGWGVREIRADGKLIEFGPGSKEEAPGARHAKGFAITQNSFECNRKLTA